MEITEDYVKGVAPVITAFAVDLLYPGLDLEIDAMAIVDPHTKMLRPSELGGRYQPSVFSDGVMADGEIYVSGQTALGSDNTVLFRDDFSEQAKTVFHRLAKVLAEADAALDDVIKLNLFFVADDGEVESRFHQACQIWAKICPNSQPAFTPVRVHELPQPGLLLQADCVAIK